MTNETPGTQINVTFAINTKQIREMKKSKKKKISYIYKKEISKMLLHKYVKAY
jgi:hypothetical protein